MESHIRALSQGQGHAHCNSEYLGNVTYMENITIDIKQEVVYGLSIDIYMFEVD